MAPSQASTASTGAWRGLRQRARDLLVRAKDEHSKPHEVGLSVGAGVFAACTPFIGFHMWIALALATAFRLNRLWAFLGSRISIVPVYVWISFCEIELGHRVRSGDWVRMSAREALSHGKELSADWGVGTLIVGGALAGVVGLAAYAVARRWPGKPASSRTPGESLPQSSESPPSAPPGSSS